MSGMWFIFIVGIIGIALTVGAAFLVAHATLHTKPLLWPLIMLAVGLIVAVGSWIGAGAMLHYNIQAAQDTKQFETQPNNQTQPGSRKQAADDKLAVGRDVQFGEPLTFANKLVIKVGAPVAKTESDGTKVEQVRVTLQNQGKQAQKVDLADFSMFSDGAIMPQLTTLTGRTRLTAGSQSSLKLSFQVAKSSDDGQNVVTYHGAGWEWQGSSF